MSHDAHTLTQCRTITHNRAGAATQTHTGRRQHTTAPIWRQPRTGTHNRANGARGCDIHRQRAPTCADVVRCGQCCATVRQCRLCNRATRTQQTVRAHCCNAQRQRMQTTRQRIANGSPTCIQRANGTHANPVKTHAIRHNRRSMPGQWCRCGTGSRRNGGPFKRV